MELLSNHVRNFNLTEVKRMLEKNPELIDISNPENGGTALTIALEHGNFEIAKYLVKDAGANANIPNANGDSAIIYAARYGNLDFILFLYFYADNLDVNRQGINGDTALHIAAINSSFEMTKALIETCGADINIRNNLGRTPLMNSCDWGSTNVSTYLIQHPLTDVNIQDDKGDTVLMELILGGVTAAVTTLIERDSTNFNIQNSNGVSALHAICISGSSRYLKKMLETGRCQVNVQNAVGLTPLHISAILSQDGVSVLLLLKYGALLSIKDNRNQTPLNLVKEKQNKKTLTFYSIILNLLCTRMFPVYGKQPLIKVFAPELIRLLASRLLDFT